MQTSACLDPSADLSPVSTRPGRNFNSSRPADPAPATTPADPRLSRRSGSSAVNHPSQSIYWYCKCSCEWQWSLADVNCRRWHHIPL